MEYSANKLCYHLNSLLIDVSEQKVRNEYVKTLKKARKKNLQKKYGDNFNKYVYGVTVKKIINL